MRSGIGRGLDGVELIIQVAVTLLLMVMVTAVDKGPDGPPDALLVPAIAVVSLLILAIRRRRALRAAAPDEAAAARLDELEDRLAHLEAGQERLLELEERLDFAERLLAQVPAAERLPNA